MAAMDTTADANLAIDVRHLNFRYNPKSPVILKDFNMALKPGTRCLLLGANGAGKSTLMKVLGGKHMAPEDTVSVLGMDAFRDLKLNTERAYLNTDWGLTTVAFAGYGCPLQADIEVGTMMKKLQEAFPERRDTLVELLGIDLKWRMHAVSDGQRRRVQLFLGLMRPFKLLLLDEITTSLDVVCRQDLLVWLKSECDTRGATIIYATHIFDGLDDWPTSMFFLTNKGNTGFQGELREMPMYKELRSKGDPSPLLSIVTKWLRDEIAADKAVAKAAGLQYTREEMSGEAALKKKGGEDTTSYLNAGGFAPGRMLSRYA